MYKGENPLCFLNIDLQTVNNAVYFTASGQTFFEACVFQHAYSVLALTFKKLMITT